MAATAEVNIEVNVDDASRKLRAFQGGIDVLGGSLETTVGSLALFGVETQWIENIETATLGAIGVADGLKRFGDGVVTLIENVKVAEVAQKAYNVVQGVFNAILAANPIALVVIAIGTLIGLVVTLKDRFEAVNKVFEFFKGLVTSVGEALGLTETEEEKAARESKERSAQRVKDIENEIKVRKAAGEETVDLEREKQKLLVSLTEEGSQERKDAEADLAAFEAGLIKEKEDAEQKAADKKKAKEDKEREDRKKKKEKEEADKKKQDEKDEADRIAKEEKEKADKEKKDEEDRKAKEKKDAEDLKAQEKADADRVALAEETAQAIEAAENDLAAAKTDAIFAGIDVLKSVAGDNEKAQNAIFALEQGLAIADVITKLQAEKAANAVYGATLGPAGIAYTGARNTAANIRAATSIATIAATSIAKFKGGKGGGDLGPDGGGGSTIVDGQSAEFTGGFEEIARQGNVPNSGNGNGAVKAYVVSGDVTSGQQADQQIQQRRTL